LDWLYKTRFHPPYVPTGFLPAGAKPPVKSQSRLLFCNVGCSRAG
jgi:hypothetical protein